jgi:hypothetical protein
MAVVTFDAACPQYYNFSRLELDCAERIVWHSMTCVCADCLVADYRAATTLRVRQVFRKSRGKCA